MVYDFNNKVVLITGAASGIGAGVVRFLLDEGVMHVTILDVAEDAGTALETKLNSKYGAYKVKFIHGDVTNDDDFNGTFKSVIDDYGHIDVVINNAGIFNDSLRTYKKQIEINVTAVVTGTLKALELMRKDQGGRGGTVINISSVASMMQTPWTPIYSATKSAVLQFSNCIGLEEYYSKTGVRVITVNFGVTDTPIVSKEKMGSYDQEIEAGLEDQLKGFPKQSCNMPYKIVETLEKGKRTLFYVPNDWENNNILHWPKFKVETLIAMEDSQPDASWSTMKCRVKRTGLVSIASAEVEVANMCAKSDTESEETENTKPQNVKRNHNIQDYFDEVSKTCTVLGWHPFHFTKVQELLLADYASREAFCRWLREERRNILWTDESTFTQHMMESAASGVVEACKRGESGSTWLVENDKPAKDITEFVRKAYGILADSLSEV